MKPWYEPPDKRGVVWNRYRIPLSVERRKQLYFDVAHHRRAILELYASLQIEREQDSGGSDRRYRSII